ncbi:MAG TPA: hypothetical protein VG713_16915, partial [Pirellulales bacterium]|nr:hypothetical protein [Pirellulales bacterium]
MIRRFSLLLVACWTVCCASRASAQQRAVPAPAPARIDPVAAELLRTNPTSPSNILRVINSLIALREPAAAAGLVQKLNEMPLDDAAMNQLFQEFGSAAFMTISRQPELQPAAKQFADKAFTAINRYARDPQRLAELIDQLKTDSLPRRAEAIGQLRLGGDAAVRALLDALADPSRSAERAAIEDAIVAFDTTALPLLASIVQNPQSPLTVEAVKLLGRLNNPEADLYLFGPVFASGY